jgi:hypothetical protein
MGPSVHVLTPSTALTLILITIWKISTSLIEAGIGICSYDQKCGESYNEMIQSSWVEQLPASQTPSYRLQNPKVHHRAHNITPKDPIICHTV